LIIRTATVEDAEPVLDIYNYYIQHSVATFDEQPLSLQQMRQNLFNTLKNYPWLVCIDDDVLTGYAYATAWKGRCFYHYSLESTVYVREGYTGCGYGLALYQQLIAEIERRGFHSVVAGISLPNDASVVMHEKLGFEKVARFRQIGRKFDQWLDVGYWQLILPDSTSSDESE